MFEGFSPRTLDFMWNLRLNNDKTWFESHKEEFKRDFQLPMKELGREVFGRVTDACAGYGFIHKVSRIYKDARRLRGGGPYRDNMWFSVEKPSEEWTATPVFWFELAPEGWSYGLGYYQAKAETMAKLRARIDRDPEAFEKLIAPLESSEEFELEGPQYARVKVSPTEKTAEWYNKKSFSLIHRQSNGDELYSPDFVSRIASGILSLMPLYDFFITLDSDSPLPVNAKPDFSLHIIDISEHSTEATSLIRRSFATVADDFNLTPENCPTNPAFTTSEALISRLNRENCYSFGLFSNKEMIGFAALMPARDGAYEITRLAVAPELRHKGYGKMLLDAAVAKSRELGATKIIIGIIDANTVLKNWYLQYGFVETAKKEYPQLPFIVCDMELV